MSDLHDFIDRIDVADRFTAALWLLEGTGKLSCARSKRSDGVDAAIDMCGHDRTIFDISGEPHRWLRPRRSGALWTVYGFAELGGPALRCASEPPPQLLDALWKLRRETPPLIVDAEGGPWFVSSYGGVWHVEAAT